MAAQLNPSAIFSPSVARQQLAAAKDWNYIDNWLSAKFNGKTPPFERNSDTLKTLLAVAALNESADEERDLFSRVEVKALQEIQLRGEVDPNAKLLDSIEEFLSREGHQSLEALSSLSIGLNQPSADTEKLGRSIIDLQISFNDLQQASDRVSILEKHLTTECESINLLIKELQSDVYQPPSELSKLTIDYQRKTKALAVKCLELRDKVVSLDSNRGRAKITIQDIKAEEDGFTSFMAAAKNLEAQVKGYYGLPEDTDLARLELESVRVELQVLTRQRDSMFEGLVERESPQKIRR
jgi:HAUS augmin-like complex subunit 1